MFTPFKNNYAYGWGVLKVPGKEEGDSTKVTTHTGGINGFTTLIFRMVDENKLIVIFNNTGKTRLRNMGQGIINILYDKPYDLPKRSLALVLLREINDKGLEAGLEKYWDIPFSGRTG